MTSLYAAKSDNCDGKKRRKKRSKETKSHQHKERRKRGVNQTERNRVQYAVILMTLKASLQKWDLKTRKEIKLNKNKTEESSSSVATDLMSSFLNVLTPSTADNFNVCNPDTYLGSSRDLFCPEDDVPEPSGVGVKNEVIMDLTEDDDWVDTGKHVEKKPALSNFLSKQVEARTKKTPRSAKSGFKNSF